MSESNPTIVSTDLDAVECPWCGAKNDWTDVLTDGCLEEGYDTECSSCGKAMHIDAVDWDPTIYVSRKEESAAHDGDGEGEVR